MKINEILVNILRELGQCTGLICGTSTCHMAVSRKPLFVPGVWGPYYSAMVPGLWLSEGGQSATGRLLDHVIQSHPATPSITANTSVYVSTFILTQ